MKVFVTPGVAVELLSGSCQDVKHQQRSFLLLR